MISVKSVTVGSLSVNCYILYDDKSAVVIDPGADGNVICAMAKELGVTIKHIILTHGHFDHIGAVGYIVKKYYCDVYLHEKDAEFLTNSFLNLSDRFGIDVAYDGSFITVKEQVLTLLGHDFKFIHTPGHTPGSMCIKVDGNLFTGDTLFRCSIGNAFSPYGDTDLEIISIKNKILMLDDSFICYPGHGETTTIKYERQFNPYLV